MFSHKPVLSMRVIAIIAALTIQASAQQRQAPDVQAQREHMAKLEFLAGKWTGEGFVTEGSGEAVRIIQSESIQFKLDGLVLLLEGTGRNPQTGEVFFSALATVSYDTAAKLYRLRSYSGGRYLETELKVGNNAFEWGYASGPASVRNVMRMNNAGDWVEYTEVKLGDNPPRRTLEMTLHREK